ncbi:YhfZ family protein [Acidisoma sp. S159]|uniref:YhfZ family protein n=1 Tax=Acidisoma sp. S159 TaxID=1747225 RepID=UPI00131B031F|nr:YhfZ family protein [Acidisoma sp. S159]
MAKKSMLTVSDDIDSAHAKTVRALANDLLGREAEERLPTLAQYSDKFRVGTGTVKKALLELERSHAVSCRPRGHMGTFITLLDIGRLWQFARRGAVSAAIGLAEAAEFRGLESGLSEAFADFGIGLSAVHVRGAKARVGLLEHGACDLALLSKAALGHYFPETEADLALLELGPNTYYARESVLVLVRSGYKSGPLRVGIDPQSFDQAELTRAEFDAYAGGVEYVEVPYSHVPAAILGGYIDAAVWHRVGIGIPLDALQVVVVPMTNKRSLAMLETLSFACLVSSGKDPAIRVLLKRLDITRIRATQAEVVQSAAEQEAALSAYFPRGVSARGDSVRKS